MENCQAYGQVMTPWQRTTFGFLGLLFGASLLMFGCATQKHGSRVHNAGHFTMELPNFIKFEGNDGIDSFVQSFRGNGILLSFDYGHYSNNFTDWPNTTRIETVQIDGREARIGTVRESFGYPFPLTTQVYFPKISEENMSLHLSVSASCRSEKEVAAARQIFTSIRFTGK